MKQLTKNKGVLTVIKTKQKSILQAVTLALLLSTCAIQAQKNKSEVFKKPNVVDENYEPFSFGLRVKKYALMARICCNAWSNGCN